MMGKGKPQGCVFYNRDMQIRTHRRMHIPFFLSSVGQEKKSVCEQRKIYCIDSR